jgi:hypothetical protein
LREPRPQDPLDASGFPVVYLRGKVFIHPAGAPKPFFRVFSDKINFPKRDVKVMFANIPRALAWEKVMMKIEEKNC